jgi:hypothetical protein
MADDFLIETTNERGVVEQERVFVDQTQLWLTDRSLVRIDSLERATTLQQLNVRWGAVQKVEVPLELPRGTSSGRSTFRNGPLGVRGEKWKFHFSKSSTRGWRSLPLHG